MLKNNQKIWRKNFEIKRVDFQLPCEALKVFCGFAFDVIKIPHCVKKVIWITQNTNNIGTYIPKAQLRKAIDAILKQVIKNPSLIDRVHQKTIALNKQYFDYARSLEDLDLSKALNTRIVQLYKKLGKIQQVSHGYSLTTTWFLDSNDQDFSRFLLNYLQNRIKKTKKSYEATTVFSSLTTPLKDSFARIEEIELLKIIKAIQEDNAAKQFFAQSLAQIKTNFEHAPQDIKTKILKHFKKWRWTPYGYIGPVYELDYYLEVILGLFRQKINSGRLLREYRATHKVNKERQKQLINDLKINKKFQHYFKIAQDIIFIKGFRKDCLYYGFYVLDKILKEVAKRLGLSLIQAKYLTYDEVGPALLKNKYSADELNARIKFSVMYCDRGKIKIFTAEKAKNFLKKIKFEKVKMNSIQKFHGMCAYPGKVHGIVKIVNLAEEIGKIKEEEIMLAHTTFPALVPAMKKASAIVTEDGGITCHAAIVSRELKKPCVVGVKNMLNILKDGDKIEVDATRGLIKIIN